MRACVRACVRVRAGGDLSQQGSLVAFDPEDDRSPQGAGGERYQKTDHLADPRDRVEGLDLGEVIAIAALERVGIQREVQDEECRPPPADQGGPAGVRVGGRLHIPNDHEVEPLEE